MCRLGQMAKLQTDVIMCANGGFVSNTIDWQSAQCVPYLSSAETGSSFSATF